MKLLKWYLSYKYKMFLKYIQYRQEEHEYGKLLNPEKIISLAKNKFDQLV